MKSKDVAMTEREKKGDISQQNYRLAFKKSDDRYFSKVVGRALSLLEIVRKSPGPLGLRELAHQMGMAKSSVFRILHTLEASEYITKNGSGNYTAATEVDHWYSRSFVQKLVDVARPEMVKLKSNFSETVSLGVLFDNHIEVVAVYESPQLVRMGNTAGRILPPHASSLGKVITAYQGENRRETLLRSYGLQRFSEHTITDEVQLGQEFEKILRRGWGSDYEESTLKGCCFGAPISIVGEVRAALSISMPTMRHPEEKAQEEMTTALKEATRRISEQFPKQA